MAKRKGIESFESKAVETQRRSGGSRARPERTHVSDGEPRRPGLMSGESKCRSLFPRLLGKKWTKRTAPPRQGRLFRTQAEGSMPESLCLLFPLFKMGVMVGLGMINP